MPEVVGLLSRLAEDYRVVLATNATSRLPSDLEALGLLHYFHAIANSSRLGVAKPAPAYFQAALQLSGLQASEAVFIDNSTANLIAPRALGMQTIHFDDATNDVAGLRRTLKENYDLLVEP